MKYLLIDFGATYIKCAHYSGGTITPTTIYNSPFATANEINKIELYKVLTNVIQQHEQVEAIVICTILGGKWDANIYKSWKCLKPGEKGATCLVSGLFDSDVVHSDHAQFTTASRYVDGLEVTGFVNNIPVYCGLGDTDCVIRSLDIPNNGVVINMGTGSQVISKTNIERFFPAGRSFLVFNKLFKFSKVSLFDAMQQLTIEDVMQSSLTIDLAVFEQGRGWNGGGSIVGITEDTFNIENVAASIVKAFVLQYKSAIGESTPIILEGGIPNKVPILPQVFRTLYPDKTIIHRSSNVEATHRGLACMIDKHLRQ
jgi:hypothetical protein